MEKNDLLLNIKEVQDGGKRLANWYLDHDYILLDIQPGARSRKHPDDGNAIGNIYYIAKSPTYVLGRPAGVPPAPPMPKREDFGNDRAPEK